MTEQSAPPAGSPEPTAAMVDLIAGMARLLVDAADQVRVDVIPDGDTTILRLHVAAGDIGKVIGRQGRTARSLRTILSAASMKIKRRYSLDIVEQE